MASLPIGAVYGRWTILSSPFGSYRHPKVHCRCLCGSRRDVDVDSIRRGASRSCGCLKVELQTTHGDSTRETRTPEYRAWADAIGRCSNPKIKCWPDYGGRGIRICNRWRESYEAFLSDMGRRPSPTHELDRIDTNGNYEPGNCRWATRVVQLENRRRRHVTRCRHGHDFTPENTITHKDGTRACRICNRRRSDEYEARQRAAAR